MQDIALSPSEIAEVFRRHPGSQKKIARQLNIRSASVSIWLRGDMGSARIESACRELAATLIAQEQAKA